MTKQNIILESYSQILSDEELQEQFDNMLDEDGPIDVCGSTLNPSFILKRCDPIKYNVLFTDYKDEIEDNDDEIEESIGDVARNSLIAMKKGAGEALIGAGMGAEAFGNLSDAAGTIGKGLGTAIKGIGDVCGAGLKKAGAALTGEPDAEGLYENETVKSDETPSETDNVITDDIESDLEILMSSYDTNIALGELDNIFYIKNGIDACWEEIPADNLDEAIEYYQNCVADAKSAQEFDNEADLEINAECNRIWESRQLKNVKKLV